MTTALLAPAVFGTPAGDAGRWLRRLTVLVVLTAGVLLRLPAAAQEPLILTGTWVGTWRIGKYEEPIELDLTQARRDLVGHVTLWGYPRAGSSGAAGTVRAPVTGTVEGHRVVIRHRTGIGRRRPRVGRRHPIARRATLVSGAGYVGESRRAGRRPEGSSPGTEQAGASRGRAR